MRVLFVLVMLLAGCGGRTERAGESAPDQFLAVSSPAVWFEGYWTPARISPRGDRAVLGETRTGDLRLFDVVTGEQSRMPDDVDAVAHVAFTADGTLAVSGTLAGVTGWFLLGRDGPRPLPIPVDALPVWSPDGHAVAWFRRAAADTLAILAGAELRSVHVPGIIGSVAWGPDGTWLLVLVGSDEGISALHRIYVDAAASTLLVSDLDAPILIFGTHRSIALSADGSRAYVALAGARPPRPELRHAAAADRDLDIYEIDLTSQDRRVVAATPGDDFGPVVADGWLYWTSHEMQQAVVVLPSGGGDARVVVPGAMLPTWRPDGRALGFTFGDWRLADWVLSWEGGIIDIAADARATGAPRPFITGYHEDFSPVWARDGRWVAYHSHRSSAPVAHYHAVGSTDDIFLRREGSTEELRLTDFGLEIGPPSWAPDGRRIVYTGWLGGPGRSGAWITTIDTVTGAPLITRPVPLPDSVGGAANATWSPTDELIAVLAPATGDRRSLWTVRPDGTVLARIAEVPLRTYGGVDWTHDGRSLVFPAIVDGRMQIHAVPAEGGSLRRLSNDDGNLLHPTVSPDGRWIAATRLTHQRQLWRQAVQRSQ